MGFLNSARVKYPVEEVFSVFIRTAKRDFPKFNESNPVGVSVTKKVDAYSVKSSSLNIEITDYKENELYKITSTGSDTIYYSTYQFEKIDENSTRITLIEENETASMRCRKAVLSYSSEPPIIWSNNAISSTVLPRIPIWSNEDA